MGSITREGEGGFGGTAKRAIGAAQRGGEGAPTIADLVGGVGRHLAGGPLVPQGTQVTPLSAYAPTPGAPGGQPTYAPPPNQAPGGITFPHGLIYGANTTPTAAGSGSPLANLSPTVGGLQSGIQQAQARPVGNPNDISQLIGLVRRIQGIR